MQITIIVDDKVVGLGGQFVSIPDLEWSKFDMDPNDPDDNVAAVQFDVATGQGHVEFKTRITKQSGRPNNRPPDWLIGLEDFERHFGWVLPFYKARQAELQAQMAEEAARREALVTTPDKQPHAEMTPMPPNTVTLEEAQAMAREEAERAAKAAVDAFAEKIATAGQT